MQNSKHIPLCIYAGQDGEGYTYALSLKSEDFLKARYPNAPLSDRLFLAQDITRDFATVHQAIAPQLLALLTQLPQEEILSLGPWEFRQPEDDALLFTWPSTPSAENTARTQRKTKTIAPTQKPPRSPQRKAAG